MGEKKGDNEVSTNNWFFKSIRLEHGDKRLTSNKMH